MIKVEIKKQDVVTNQAKFETQELAEAWVNQESLNGSFGKIDRWLKESDFDDETIEQSVDSREGSDSQMEYKFLKEFDVVYTDVTSDELAKKESIEAKKFLNDTDWYCARFVDSGTVIPQEIKDLRAAARLKVID